MFQDLVCDFFSVPTTYNAWQLLVSSISSRFSTFFIYFVFLCYLLFNYFLYLILIKCFKPEFFGSIINKLKFYPCTLFRCITIYLFSLDEGLCYFFPTPK